MYASSGNIFSNIGQITGKIVSVSFFNDQKKAPTLWPGPFFKIQITVAAQAFP
jgi:hypothetical protein